MENFLIESADHKMVRPKQHNFRIDVSPEYLNAYNSDADERIRNSLYIQSRDFLVMPVVNSPMYIFLTSSRGKWVAKYTDSLQVITNLTIMIHAYTTNPGFDYYIYNKERIDTAKELWDENLTNLDARMKDEELPRLYRRFAAEELNEKQALEEFIHIMERATIERIRISERCLAMIFRLPCIETPMEFPSADVFPRETREGIPRVFCNFFDTKQQIMNERMKQATPEDEEYRNINYFDIEDMKTRLQLLPKEEIYKGYLDRMTAWEYFVYLDISDILKK